MSVSNLVLTDDNNNVYNFPQDFWISNDSWDTNKNITNTFYAPGGRNKADGFLKSRIISITGQLRADSLAAYETLKRNFIQAILKGGKLSKTIDSVTRYIYIKLPNANTGREQFQRYQDITIDFVAENPFWFDSTETTEVNIVAGNDTLSIDNSGSDFLVSPTIEIDADQSADVPAVKLINVTDSGMQLQYNDLLFVQGDTVSINCLTGEVTRNGGESIENFRDAFLRLQPSTNSITYEGNACTITFRFRKAYL